MQNKQDPKQADKSGCPLGANITENLVMIMVCFS